MTYVPIDGKPFALTMGLRSLNLENWIEIDQHCESELGKKKDLLTNNHSQVFAALPEGLHGSQETLDLLVDYLPKRFPELYPSPITTDESLHPLEAASLLVQEDLVVMSPRDDQWVLTAACVCFPSRWDLTTKLGRNLFEIHAPVPDYNNRIGVATNTMFGKFTANRPVWRINWTVLDTDELYLPSGAGRREHIPSDTQSFADSTFFRTERQTMRVLPSNDVLFTIRTYVDSLSSIDLRYPEFRENLGQTLATVTPEMREYKGWEPMWSQLMTWSQQQ